MLRFITLCIPHKTDLPLATRRPVEQFWYPVRPSCQCGHTNLIGSGVRRDRHAVSPVSMFIYYSPVHRHGQEVFTYMRRQLTGGITI